MNREEVLDAFIVGAGPIGLACGIEAERRGLSYVIADKGCLVNSLYNYPYNMTFFSTSDRLEIGEVPFISHGNKPNRSEALEYYRRVASSWKLHLRLYEKVLEITDQGSHYHIETERGRLSFTVDSNCYWVLRLAIFIKCSRRAVAKSKTLL